MSCPALGKNVIKNQKFWMVHNPVMDQSTLVESYIPGLKYGLLLVPQDWLGKYCD